MIGIYDSRRIKKWNDTKPKGKESKNGENIHLWHTKPFKQTNIPPIDSGCGYTSIRNPTDTLIPPLPTETHA